MTLDWDQIIKTIESFKEDHWILLGLKYTRNDSIHDVRFLECFGLKPVNFYSTSLVNGKSDIYNFVGFYINYWHILVKYLKQIEKIPGFKTFKKQYPSHTGFENQLFATIYLLNTNVKIIAIEDGYKGVDADITVMLNNTVAYIHVKTLGQYKKRKLQSDAYSQLFFKLFSHPVLGKNGKRIGIKDIQGICPRALSKNEIDEIIAAAINNRLVTREFNRGIHNKTRNKVVSDRLTFVFDDWNNCTTGKCSGIDELWNFENNLLSVDKKAEGYKNNGKHIILFVCNHAVDYENFNERIENSKNISALFFLSRPVGQNTVHFSRSKIYGKKSEAEIVAYLENNLPSMIDI